MPLSALASSQLLDILRNFRAAYAPVFIPANDGKALEAFVMMKLAHHVHQAPMPWTISLRQGDGTPLPPGAPFGFPNGKSGIRAASLAAPCFIMLQHQQHSDRRLEMHSSLQWRGRSTAKHEIDVSVIPAVIAESLRGNGGGFPRGLPVAAIECKDKHGVGPLDETRQKLARMFDLVLVTQPGPGWSCRIYASRTQVQWGTRSSTYRAFFRKGTFAIVRAGTFQSGAGVLADHYSVKHCPEIYSLPLSMGKLETSFRTTLARIAEF
ncbi:hypothetical protein GGC65_003415 [Sphingopyxis sp. OAS728]|uniref:hypothetical protein n=1 Tax=Sphingopyxis sp. OAS728 TaxID=2663823 RepID=UPI00178A3157|nr:hypothetical protein [Sphingopyxis sp. OAS728]MBE1528959.1 hypothetical protein [Sphingopyxis sp. OAS728]